MEKWVRRGLQAAVTAGAVSASAAGVGHADDATVVAPGVVSDSVSVAGDNSILSGNSLSVPIVVPITDNKVAVTGIGAAVNAEDAVLSLGLLGAGIACGSASGDYTDVSPFVRSSSTSVVGDNSILSGNSLSAPIVAPITGNDVAIAGIGGAVNADSVAAALGILGGAHAGDCDDNGNGGYPGNGGNGNGGYPHNGDGGHKDKGDGGNGGDPYDPYGYSEASSDTTVVTGKVVSAPTSVVGDNSIGSGNSLSVPVLAPITGNDVAVAGIGGAVNAEDVVAALGLLGGATAESGDGAGGGGDETVVAPTVVSAPSSKVGDNSVGSGNSLSVPIVAPVTDNKAAGTVIGGAVNADEVTAAVGAAGTAHAENGAADETVVAPTVVSAPSSEVGDNSILSGNSLSAPIVAPITGNDVAATGIGGAVNAEDVSLAAGILGTATSLLGN